LRVGISLALRIYWTHRTVEHTARLGVEQRPADEPITVGDLAVLRSRWVDKEGRHRYSITGYICNRSKSDRCTEDYADKVFAYVNSIDVPFSTEDLGRGPKDMKTPFGIQPIRHDEYIAERRSVNRTLENHRYHPGEVTNEVYFDRDGNLVYRVVGTGTGPHPWENVLAGVPLFQQGVEDVVLTFNHGVRDQVRMLNALRGPP